MIACGDNKLGQCDLSHWTDIISVAAGNVHHATNTGNSHSIGLRSDGIVLAAGGNNEDAVTYLCFHELLYDFNYLKEMVIFE